MNILEISQIVFNIVASATILVVGLLIGIIAIEIIFFIKRTKKLVADAKQQSFELYRKLDGFLAGMATLPFISGFFKKSKKK